MPAKPTSAPDPDEYGRLRVRDEDTGHKLTINAPALPHGNYAVLNEPASSPAGDPLPTIHQSSVGTTNTSGQQAESKENRDA